VKYVCDSQHTNSIVKLFEQLTAVGFNELGRHVNNTIFTSEANTHTVN